MVKFYVMKIKDGVITIEDVPDLWKAKEMCIRDRVAAASRRVHEKGRGESEAGIGKPKARYRCDLQRNRRFFQRETWKC